MLALTTAVRKGMVHLLRQMPWSYQDKICYFRRFGTLPDLQAPRLFNEKILYRKYISGDPLRYAALSDKLMVREYIARTIGDACLIPLIHQTDNPLTLLTLNELKNTVIKPNHGSGMVAVMLHEPDNLQKQRLIAECGRWLQQDYSLHARELHYRYITPRILVERFIGDPQQAAVDYKFHMFRQADGGFRYVLQVISNRGAGQPLSMNFYVDSLERCFWKIRDTGFDIRPEQGLLQQALLLSQQLAADFDYVRVDWYLHQQQIYFGELTFTPGAGMVTGLDNGLNQLMGEMWQQERRPLPSRNVPEVAAVTREA